MKKFFVISLFCIIGIFSFYYFHSSDVFLTVIGPAVMEDGIGRQSLEVIKALRKDVKTNYKPTKNSKGVPKDIKTISKYSRDVGKVILFEDVLATCSEKHLKAWLTSKRKKSLCIAYTMLESTRTSLQMVNNLNDYFDMAVVPDPFLIQAYRDSGVKIPIFYLPLGLYLDNFLKAPLKEYKNSPFVFAYLSSCINRKNQLSLIRAFSIAFKDNPDVLLKINFRGGDESYIKAVITEVEKLQDKRIILTHNCLNNREYLNFFEGIDCYISISKGEGFSIQPREAMTLGIPVIVSDNTAQSTIVQSGLVRAVRSQITEPAFYIFNKCESKSSCNGKVINPIFYLGDVVGSNYGCKVRDIADAMKDVYEHYDDYLVNKERARAWASSYQYDKLTSLYKSMVMPKRVILGDEDIITEEYVMTSSKDLYKKYNDIIKNL